MASNETSNVDSSASRKKVAQLFTAIKDCLDIEYFESILQKEGNINYDVKDISEDVSLLHSAYRFVNLDVFELLLDHNADFTVKDNEGDTIVHKIIKRQYLTHESSYIEFENKFLDAVFSAHGKFQNSTNPCCDYNISHFHVACMKNRDVIVEDFLKNGIDVNQAVNVNSPIFAGYTPMHFAIKFSCLKAGEILLKYGANVNLNNADGMNPLEVLLERKINEKIGDRINCNESALIEVLAKYVVSNDNNGMCLSNLHIACVIKDTSTVESVLSNRTLNVNQPVGIDSHVCSGFTSLHFAAIFNVDTVKLLINRGAHIEAKDANGITPFDLCLQSYSVEDINYIISSQSRWKDITLSDNKTKLIDLISTMTSDDDFTEFLAKFESLESLTIPIDSPLWPGYTILHLSVIFAEKSKNETNYFGHTSDTKKVEACLIRGANVTKLNTENSTALHLAFYMQKFRTVELLLKHHLTPENPLDNNDLSHFHIACAARDETAVERFLSNGVDVNIPIATTLKWHVLVRYHLYCKPRHMFITPGSTALHINAACGNVEITKILLENGADIYAKDVYGSTAIHRFLTSCIRTLDEGIDGLLFGIDGLQDSINDVGLSHLHVACSLGNYNYVERLIDSGANVNAVVTQELTNDLIQELDFRDDPYGDPTRKPLSFLSRYNGFTPLQFSIEECDGEIQKLLIKRGADILAGSFRKCVPIKKIFGNELDYNDEIFRILMKDNGLKNRLKDKFDITPLHIACYTNSFELVGDLICQGEDVNARVNEKSPVWSGYTPLHIAAKNVDKSEDEDDSIGIFNLLLGNGADVTLINNDRDTPLQLLGRVYKQSLARCKFARLMLGSLKEFDVNVAHSQWMSFFHFACLIKNLPIVEAYLKNGIDVNRSVDSFADCYAGCSPLHLAAGYGVKSSTNLGTQLIIVELLLKNGADVQVKDVYESTPLHSAARSTGNRQELFDLFIRDGVDVNSVNISGDSALEVLINSGNAYWKEVQYLLKHGAHINSFNSITKKGSIARLLDDSANYEKKALDNDVIKNLINSEYVDEVDEDGRSILHNIVSVQRVNIVDYPELIRQLVKRGCDVNHQDKKGMTALHTASRFRNTRGILGLLRNGADVNVTDKSGKTAFTYSFEPPNNVHTFENHSDPNHVINIFAMHVHKMERCGLYINEINERLQVNAIEMYYFNEDVLEVFDNNLRTSKNLKIGSTDLTLYEFGFEIDAEMIYPIMSLSERLEIDLFFENIRQHNLYELDYLLKIKYEKAVERLRFINLAVEPFIDVVKYQLPDLCCRVVLSFLSSSDLINVIATADL